MIDFESHLTALLDDVAASIEPHADPDGIFRPTVPTVSTQHRVTPPRFVAVAAAGLILLGGSAFAMERLTNDPPARVVPADEPVTDATQAVDTTTAPIDTEPPAVVTTSPDKPSVSKPVLVVDPTVPAREPTTVATEPTTTAVAVIEFTAKLGTDGRANTPMTQGFYGTADPGATIRITSAYGATETTANGDGKWQETLTMRDVPAGTKVAVRITSSTSDRVREFTLERPAPPPPAVIEFTAKLGADGRANNPMTQGFFGTAQPGSAIHLGSDWGSADTVAGPNGKWDATLVMPEVPAGTMVAVRITSSTSDRVREFTLERPGTPPPSVISFTAAAGWTTTDATPPVCEYGGTATPGAIVTVSSDYGGVQVQANADGRWSARPTFPDAPVGTTFNVHITSSLNDGAFNFALTRVAPV